MLIEFSCQTLYLVRKLNHLQRKLCQIYQSLQKLNKLTKLGACLSILLEYKESLII